MMRVESSVYDRSLLSSRVERNTDLCVRLMWKVLYVETRVVPVAVAIIKDPSRTSLLFTVPPSWLDHRSQTESLGFTTRQRTNRSRWSKRRDKTIVPVDVANDELWYNGRDSLS